eukprot:scaffold101256_cov72-Phaeocystis_antarctica.AAC.5
MGLSRPAVSRRSSSDTTADAFSRCGANSSRPSVFGYFFRSCELAHVRPKPDAQELNPKSTREERPLRRPIIKGAPRVAQRAAWRVVGLVEVEDAGTLVRLHADALLDPWHLDLAPVGRDELERAHHVVHQQQRLAQHAVRRVRIERGGARLAV